MQEQQPSIEELFEQGIVPEFDRELTAEEKELIVNSALESVFKPLMYAFYLAGLQDFIRSNVINHANGDHFELSFKRIITGNESPQTNS